MQDENVFETDFPSIMAIRVIIMIYCEHHNIGHKNVTQSTICFWKGTGISRRMSSPIYLVMEKKHPQELRELFWFSVNRLQPRTSPYRPVLQAIKILWILWRIFQTTNFGIMWWIKAIPNFFPGATVKEDEFIAYITYPGNVVHA